MAMGCPLGAQTTSALVVPQQSAEVTASLSRNCASGSSFEKRMLEALISKPVIVIDQVRTSRCARTPFTTSDERVHKRDC